MNTPLSLSIDEKTYQRLHCHLFPGDCDEHGAVIAAGIVQTPRGTRLLARDLFLARDGIDYVPGRRGYRALTAEFVARISDYCAGESLTYLAVHNHGGRGSVAFSSDDLASHERGYPALLDITGGGPVGALVLAEDAIAGDIWTRHGVRPLSHSTIVGMHIRRLYPTPPARPPHADAIYDRHARLFGDLGQSILSGLKVGIIGLGGGGSLISEWLARLGVGHIVAIDPQRLDVSNIPRVVGSTRRDALAFFATSSYPALRRLAQRFARHKVHIARRVAKQANPQIRYDAVVGNILDEETAQLLVDADFLFLATDSIQSRLVFNALVHQYLIPGVQVGCKVQVNKPSGQVGDVFSATRLVLPTTGGGCLHCNNLIPPARLAEEGLSPDERRAQLYVDAEEVVEPSVITLNVLSAGQAVNDLLFMCIGLFKDDVVPEHHLNMARERVLNVSSLRVDQQCLHCSNSSRSRLARGDRARLPVRQASRE